MSVKNQSTISQRYFFHFKLKIQLQFRRIHNLHWGTPHQNRIFNMN